MIKMLMGIECYNGQAGEILNSPGNVPEADARVSKKCFFATDHESTYRSERVCEPEYPVRSFCYPKVFHYIPLSTKQIRL